MRKQIFITTWRKKKTNSGNTSEYGKQFGATLEADKAAYPKLYKAKKAKIKDLLSSKKKDWLQMPAVVTATNATYNAYDILDNIGKFYDAEGEYKEALYILSPAYFKTNTTQASTKPVLIEVQFRYEIAEDRGFSSRLFNNF